MAKGKLHELLAVEKDRKGTFQKILIETHETFTKRKEHFSGMVKRYEPLVQDDPEKLEGESKPLVTTANEKLKYFENNMKNFFDIVIQKETTNMSAAADIIVEDDEGVSETIAEKIPVTALLPLENYLEEIRAKVYDVIPTLDPNRDWKKDIQKTDVYKTEEARKIRTKKVVKPIVKAQATDKFPAQVELVPVDDVAGFWVQTDWSSAMTPADKSILLGKVTKLIEGVKRARGRANDIAVVDIKIGQKIVNYLHS
jgi:hypothetical protein